MSEENKVTNIRYKQMDRDPEIKAVTNDIERLILGEQGVGFSEHLGITPGKVLKSLEDQRQKEIEALLEEHHDHIFWEARKRSAIGVQAWITEMKESETPITEEAMTEKLTESTKASEIEVIEELIEKYL
ncbi:hypothetical protein RKD55_004573 [Rossellomorea marisflavi]